MAAEYEWALDLSPDDWISFLAGDLKIAGQTAPPMPAVDFQTSWVGACGFTALKEGADFLGEVRSKIPPLPYDARVLDFGCGWGRLYRTLLRDPFEVVGIDSEPSVLKMCRDAIPAGKFLHIKTMPPYPLDASSFDFIFAFSVFSHLAENPAKKILAEISRVAKPGAHLALTLLKRSQFEALSDQDGMGFSFSGERFCYIPAGGGCDTMKPADYGWAYISDACLTELLSGLPLKLIERSSPENVRQDVAIIRKSA